MSSPKKRTKYSQAKQLAKSEGEVTLDSFGSSLLARRPKKLKQHGLLCVNTNEVSSPVKKPCVNKLLTEKKLSVINESDKSLASTAVSEISYIFVSDKSIKTQKEGRILDFLNNEGVFQIHLAEAMKNL